MNLSGQSLAWLVERLRPAIAKGRHSHYAIAIARGHHRLGQQTVRVRIPLALTLTLTLTLTLVAYRKVWQS